MNFLSKGTKFLAAEALIICTFIAQIFSVFFILFVQSLIPAFRRLFEVNDNIMYILPVLAVLFLSLLFVKLNNKFFQMRLRDVIKYFLIAAILCAIIVVLLGLLISFLFSFVPESVKHTIKTIVGLPFVMLVVLGRFSGYLLLISLIYTCVICIIGFPLVLFSGFSIASIYEKLPTVPKKIINLLLKIFLLVYFITVVVFSFRRSVNDMLVIDRGVKYDESFYRTIKQIHRQGDYDFVNDNLGVFSSMVEYDYPFKCLELFIEYGFDLKEHEAYLDYIHSKEQMKFFLEHGIDADTFIIDAVKESKYDYDTILMLLDAGADVNKKEKYSDNSGDYSVIMWYLLKLDERSDHTDAYNILTLLVGRGADLNYRCGGKETDFYGPRTALGVLLSAPGWYQHSYVRDDFAIYLMEHGADPKNCLPAIYTLQDLHNWYDIPDGILERMAESGVKTGGWKRKYSF